MDTLHPNQLEKMPHELLGIIAEPLISTKSFTNLLCVSRQIKEKLTASLYRKYSNKMLNWAIEKQLINLVDVALAHGADLHNEHERRGRTPLSRAVLIGSEEMTKYFLDKGANVNTRNHDGFTPIMLACRASTSLVEFLLENGADLTLIPDSGDSPLSVAILNGKSDIVEFLLQKGLDPNGFPSGTYRLHSLLERCAEFGTLASLRLLIQYGAKTRHDDVERGRRGPIASSLRSPRDDELEARIRLLLDAGADPNEADTDGTSALRLALQLNESCRESVVRMLLDSGANPNGSGRCYGTPISYCIANDDFDMVEVLRSYGGDLEARDYKGITAAAHAASLEKKDILEKCVALGLDWDAEHPRCLFRETPLERAGKLKGFLMELLGRTETKPLASASDTGEQS